MEGVLQSVKLFLTALTSHSSSLIKYQTDSILAKINHVSESLTDALQLWKRISQNIEDNVSKISYDEQFGPEKNGEKRSESSQRQEERRQSVEIVFPGRCKNNYEEESELDVLSALGSSNRFNDIQGDDDRFPGSNCQDMAKDEAVNVAGEDGAVTRPTRVAAVPETEVVGGEENKGQEPILNYTIWRKALHALSFGDIDSAYAEAMLHRDRKQGRERVHKAAKLKIL